MQEDHAVCSDDASAEHNAEAVRAPRHGLNAKALLLQAAAQAAQEAADIEERAPDTIPAQDQEIANLKAAFAASGKLLSGVPKRETPIVAFVNTTKIPRATRQQVLQKLAGQHLTMALMDAECELLPDQVAARDDLRKVALKAAIEQELKLFKSCMSKASYLNAAARTDATLVKFPPESVQPHSQPKASASAQQAPALMASNSQETGTSQGLVQHAVAEYVRALLDPFYKAGIVDREMYKLVIKKAVAKILQNHSSAEDTDFLIRESEQILKLVREYIRYAQKKLHR
ncbi:hypothetical protein WJX79_002997 [Trebouxia sp. C0005]